MAGKYVSATVDVTAQYDAAPIPLGDKCVIDSVTYKSIYNEGSASITVKCPVYKSGGTSNYVTTDGTVVGNRRRPAGVGVGTIATTKYGFIAVAGQVPMRVGAAAVKGSAIIGSSNAIAGSIKAITAAIATFPPFGYSASTTASGDTTAIADLDLE